MTFEICKGRFRFQLTIPYSKKRQEVARRSRKISAIWLNYFHIDKSGASCLVES